MIRIVFALVLLLGAAGSAHAQLAYGSQVLFQGSSPKPNLPITIPRLWFTHAGNVGTAESKWCDLETSGGVYTFTPLDTQVTSLSSQGYRKIIYTLGGVPGSANGTSPATCGGGANMATPPTTATPLYNFVTALVAHLHATFPTVQFVYELWNEPTSPTYWNSADTLSGTVIGATMAGYIPTLNSLIRAGDPTALIASPSPVGTFIEGWMDSFLLAGLAQYVDIIAYHPYAIPGTYQNYAEQMHDIDTVMMQQAAAYPSAVGKPLWGTEGSYSSAITDAPTQRSWASRYNIIALCDGLSYANWYGWDTTNTWGQIWDGVAAPHNGLNTLGQFYKNTLLWTFGATCSTPLTRTPGTNGVRNPTGTGVVVATPGTPPTNWIVNAPDVAKGVTTQFLTGGTSNGVPYVKWRVFGTPTAGASGFTELLFEANNQVAAVQGQIETLGANVSLDAGSSYAGTSTVTLRQLYNNASGTNLANSLLRIYPTTGLSVDKQRYSYTFAGTTALTAFIQPELRVSYTVGTAFDITLDIAAPSLDNGTVWTASLTQNGITRQVGWDEGGGPTAFTTSGYSWQRTLQGDSKPIVSNTVSLTLMPQIFEATRWKAFVQ